MKRSITFITFSTLVLVATLGLAPVSASAVQAAPAANQITIENQDVSSGMVVIDSVTAAQDGWVVIYKNPNLDLSDIVGHAWVHQGVNTGVKVVVNTTVVADSSTLWAAFQADNEEPSVRQKWGDGGTNIPGNAAQNGPTAVTAFATLATGTTPAKAVTDRITIRNQDTSTGFVLVDSVAIDQDGWVVIYRDPSFSSDQIIGYAPVYRGMNTNVLVKIDTSKLQDQPTLWAQLHVDAGALGTFEWGNFKRLTDGESVQLFNDYPATQNGHNIMASFATMASATGTSTPAGTNQISVRNQSLNTGVIVIDSVTAAQNGWVVIYNNPRFGAGDIVGYAPVYQGTNYGVKVTVEANKLTDNPPTLWAVLHVDQGLPHVFEWGNNGRAFDDPPVFQKGSYVAAGFGTSGP